MGLDLRACAAGVGEFEQLRVGSYGWVHRVRVAVVGAFTVALWQLDGGNEDDLGDYLLSWITNASGDHLFPETTGVDRVTLTEEDVKARLAALPSVDLEIAYSLIEKDVWSGLTGKLAEGVLDDQVLPPLSGLVKYVDHSDADGWLSPGDAVDVLACFRFIVEAAQLVLPAIFVEQIQEHAAFFERVVEAEAWVEFR